MRVPWKRAIEKQLINRKFALKYVALSQANLLFDLVRSPYLDMHNQVLEARTVASDFVDDRLPEQVSFFGRPWPVCKFRGTVLDEVRHPVLAWRRNGRIPGGRNHALYVGIVGEATTFPTVVRPLHGLQ